MRAAQDLGDTRGTAPVHSQPATPMNSTPSELRDLLDATLEKVAAPWIVALGLKVVEAGPQQTVLELPVTAQLVHGGGVLCGQAMLAAADTAMVLALTAAEGAFRPMTTVQLQTSFLRPVPADTACLRVVCTVLRKGKSLAFGEIECLTPDGRLAAHATTTYALL
jgi:uncharacterized protein (TIGR00369 family)